MESRWFRALTWVFFAATAYLMIEEAARPWIRLPALGNIGFTLVFVLFSLLHCASVEGLRRTGLFFSISAIVSYLMEEIGVRTGLIFGAYHYGNLLGVKLGHVPVIIPLAWFMMIYPAWMVAAAITRGINTHSLPGLTAKALIAAWAMTAWDLVMDPGMADAGNWIWEDGGPYFGVPFHNYFGWLLTTFLVYWIAGLLWRSRHRGIAVTKLFDALPVIIYSLFAARYVASNRIPALRIIALFSMGMPALVALTQVCLNRNNEAAEHQGRMPLSRSM
jgi:putative membrane protein